MEHSLPHRNVLRQQAYLQRQLDSLLAIELKDEVGTGWTERNPTNSTICSNEYIISYLKVLSVQKGVKIFCAFSYVYFIIMWLSS